MENDISQVLISAVELIYHRGGGGGGGGGSLDEREAV